MTSVVITTCRLLSVRDTRARTKAIHRMREHDGQLWAMCCASQPSGFESLAGLQATGDTQHTLPRTEDASENSCWYTCTSSAIRQSHSCLLSWVGLACSTCSCEYCTHTHTHTHTHTPDTTQIRKGTSRQAQLNSKPETHRNPQTHEPL